MVAKLSDWHRRCRVLFVVSAAFAVLLFIGGFATTAFAQTSITVSAQNDERFRGRSVANGEPVLTGSIGYDDLSGVYVGGSLTLTTNGEDVGVLGASGHIGYASFVAPNVSIDGGFTVIAYSDRYSGGTEQTFVEAFGGVSAGDFAFHVSYSPSYLDQGLQTVYLEFDAVKELGDGFRVNASVGWLRRLGGIGDLGGADSRYDAQFGVTKDFDRLSVYAVAGFAGSGRGQYFSGPWQGRDSLVLGVSYSF